MQHAFVRWIISFKVLYFSTYIALGEHLESTWAFGGYLEGTPALKDSGIRALKSLM